MNNKSSAFYFVSMNAHFNAKFDAVYTLALDNVQYYALVLKDKYGALKINFRLFIITDMVIL